MRTISAANNFDCRRRHRRTCDLDCQPHRTHRLRCRNGQRDSRGDAPEFADERRSAAAAAAGLDQNTTYDARSRSDQGVPGGDRNTWSSPTDSVRRRARGACEFRWDRARRRRPHAQPRAGLSDFVCATAYRRDLQCRATCNVARVWVSECPRRDHSAARIRRERTSIANSLPPRTPSSSAPTECAPAARPNLGD